MNRAQRRSYTKAMRAKGYTEKEIYALITMADIKDKSKFAPRFRDGERVALNYEQIVTAPDYRKKEQCTEPQVVEYRKFVEDHKDAILTVVNGKNPDRDYLVSFKEDPREDDCKFLFWVGDLIKISDGGD